MSKKQYVKEIFEGDSFLWQEGRSHAMRFDIELTERCNLNCSHCYINKPAGDRQARTDELSAAEINAVLSQAAAMGKLRLLITGGEPLLRPDFADIYLHARSLGMQVRLYTNGTLLTDEHTTMFKRVSPMDRIEVSVYGMSAETYEAVTRTPGSYRKFQRGVDLLRKHDIPFLVKFLVLPENKAEEEAFMQWAQESDFPTRVPYHGTVFKKSQRSNVEQRCAAIDRVRMAPQEVIRLMKLRNPHHVEELSFFCSRFLGPPGERLFRCGCGIGGVMDPYGKVFGCLPFRDPSLAGDVRKQSLREIFEDRFGEMRKMRASNPAYLARCAKCFLKGFCNQCPADSYSESGTLDTPVAYFCEISHAFAYDIGLLEEGEKAWEIEDWRQRLDRLEVEAARLKLIRLQAMD
jgi:radical SAM protein with 4Fe4S-binding SPASM domain